MAHTSNQDRVEEAFTLFDVDCDGQLLVSEASQAIRALGHVLTDSEMKSLLHKAGVDLGRGGKVDLAKFKQMNKSLPPKNYSKQLEEALKTLDKDGVGFMMVTEMKHMMTNMGDRISQEDINILLEELDIDNDGRILFKEFIRLLDANR